MKSSEWNNILFQDKMLFMKEQIKKILALKIKALRESKGMTQENLAALCNVSWRTISNLERGLVVPDLIMLLEMARIFGITIDQMLDCPPDSSKTKSRLEREQFIVEKIRVSNDKVLDFLFDEVKRVSQLWGKEGPVS